MECHSKMTRLVFIQSNIGPYHIPRLFSFKQICERHGYELINIELAGKENRYWWDKPIINRDLNILNLFPNLTLEDIPNYRLWSCLRLKLQQLNPSVIMLVGYSLRINRQTAYWAKMNNIPIVLVSDTTYQDKKRYPIFEFIKKKFVKTFDAAFVAGVRSKDYLISLGLNREKITVGCDVVDNEYFYNWKFSNEVNKFQQLSIKLPDKKFFLFVGRFIKEKNITSLIYAYDQYSRKIDNQKKMDLVFCGSGPEEEKLKKIISSLGINGIHFEGFIDYKILPFYYAKASCLILPSFSETWGLVVNEAMASSLPVLVSEKCGCTPDLISQGQNGWSFNPFNINELAFYLEKISLMSITDLELVGEKGRLIIDNWGLDKFAIGALKSCEIAISIK